MQAFFVPPGEQCEESVTTSENFWEIVKTGNVDKIRWCQEKQKVHFYLPRRSIGDNVGRFHHATL